MNNAAQFTSLCMLWRGSLRDAVPFLGSKAVVNMTLRIFRGTVIVPQWMEVGRESTYVCSLTESGMLLCLLSQPP